MRGFFLKYKTVITGKISFTLKKLTPVNDALAEYIYIIAALSGIDIS